MSTARPSSTKVRRQCFDAHKWVDKLTGRIMLTCHLCKGPIDPTREKWEAEHAVRHILSEDNSPANVLPAHPSCHKSKTKRDVTDNAKGKRIKEKHFGITRKIGGFRKKPEGFKYDWGTKRYVKVEDE